MIDQGSRGLILLGEDDPDQSEILTELLSLEGFEVMVGERPQKVIDLLHRHPDVVLLALVGISTPAVVEAINSMRPRPGMILVSADHRLAEKARIFGADGHLAKPYEVDQL